MSQLARISHAVYHEPWLILPSAHATIRDLLARHNIGKAEDMPKPTKGTDIFGEPLPSYEVDGSIAIIPICGTIMKAAGVLEKACGACSIEDVRADLRQALADPSVEGIVLSINSPGGYVTGVQELADEIAAAREEKPVLAFSDELCASAAYWLAAGAGSMMVAPSSHIGSVGVYQYLLDSSEAYRMEGLRPEVIVSSGSTYKAAGAPGTSLTLEQKAELQRQVDRINAGFRGFVQAQRPGVNADALKGQCVDGEEAVAMGLADDLGDMESAIEECRRMAGMAPMEDPED